MAENSTIGGSKLRVPKLMEKVGQPRPPQMPCLWWPWKQLGTVMPSVVFPLIQGFSEIWQDSVNIWRWIQVPIELQVNAFPFSSLYFIVSYTPTGPLCFSTNPASHWSKSGLVLGQRRGGRWVHHLGVHQELDHLWWQRQRHCGACENFEGNYILCVTKYVHACKRYYCS